MFESKSDINCDLESTFKLSIFDFPEAKIGVVQLEMLNVETFLSSRRFEIMDKLVKFKLNSDLDLIFLTCIDVGQYYTYFLTVNSNTKNLLISTLGAEFSGDLGHIKKILMRKQIMPIIKHHLANPTTSS